MESLPTKILTVQSPVNTNQLQYTVGKHIFNWVQSNLVEIISSIGVTVGILFTVLNYRITFLKWIGRNSGVSQKKIAKRYQDYLREELVRDSIFEMIGIDSDKATVNLTDTFIPVNLSIDNPEKQLSDKGNPSYVSPEEALKGAVSSGVRMLLIKGEPGSGKTTIIKHFALTSDIKLSGFASPLPVLYLPLNIMSSLDDKRDSLDRKLSEYFEPHLKIENSFFDECLKNGRSLVLLDGLDELSDKEQRKKVCAWISKAALTWENAFFVLTTRDKGYGEPEQSALRISKQIAYVQRFTPKQQLEFVQKWFSAVLSSDLPKKNRNKIRVEKWLGVAFLRGLFPKNYNKILIAKNEEASNRAKAFDAYLSKPEHKGMRDDLAGIPMLLHLMAILWQQSKIIPNEREKLYDIALDYLLIYREKEHKITPLLPGEVSKKLLKPLSLWMQDENEDAVKKDAFHKRMQIEINRLPDAEYRKQKAENICEDFVLRAGVLDQLDSSYIFIHKTFREYFAGLQLARVITFESKRIESLVDQIGIPWWDEPLLFFVTQVDSCWFSKLMNAFFISPRSESLDQQTLNFLLKLISKAPIDVEVFRDNLLKPCTSKDKQFYLLKCLQTIGTIESADAAQKFIDQYPTDEELRRAALAVIASVPNVASTPLDLNAFTKPKSDEGTLELLSVLHFSHVEQNAQYILIKNGHYSKDGTKQVGDLYVAKYPVTNKLYRKFIAWLQSVETEKTDDILTEKLMELAKTIPGFQKYLGERSKLSELFWPIYDVDRRFNEEDQPVVGVSWYAARSYCLWISLMASNGMDNKKYRLPLEFEWEYAAAGKENRKYPWLDKEGNPNSELLNFNGYVGSTTPVGSYSKGATPEGLYDMAGNVWEWSDSWYEKSGLLRVLRGGCLSSRSEDCQTNYRGDGNAGNRTSDVGFRLVFVP